MDKKDILRRIPKLDEVLQEQPLFDFFEENGNSVVTEAAREAIGALRAEILEMSNEIAESYDVAKLDKTNVAMQVRDLLIEEDKNNLIVSN